MIEMKSHAMRAEKSRFGLEFDGQPRLNSPQQVLEAGHPLTGIKSPSVELVTTRPAGHEFGRVWKQVGGCVVMGGWKIAFPNPGNGGLNEPQNVSE
jgi:hypothetical protein